MKQYTCFDRCRTLVLMLLLISFGTAVQSEEPAASADQKGKTAEGPASVTVDREKYARLMEHDRAGTAAFNKNDFVAARKEYEASIALSVELFGENSSQTAHRCYSMALSCYHQGEYDRAIEHYARALRIYSGTGDEDRLRTGFCYQGLGQCYHFKGEYGRALQLLSKALDIYENAGKAGRQFIGTTYYDIGVAYQYMGDYARAEEQFNRAMEINRKIFGEDHAYLATIHYALGEIAKFRGDIDTSIERYQKALDLYLKAYGPDHPYVGTTYYAIAFAHESRGEFEKAVTFYERARRIYAAAYGEKHPHVAVACHGLGNVHNAMGEHEKAIPYFDRAIGIYLSVFGENHINTAASLIGLGNAYKAAGNQAAAFSCFERALAIHRAVLGESHPETGQSYFGIGMARARAGDFDAALRDFGRAREIFAASLGETHPLSADVMLQTGRVYYSMNDAAKARELMEKALALYRDKSLHAQIIAASNMLGVVCLDAGEPLKARPYFDGSIAEIEKERFEAGADRTEFMRRHINSYYYSLKSSAMAEDIESVFGAAESMRARGFLDRMTLATALTAEGVSKEDRERLIGLNDAIEALASRRSAEIRKPTAAQDGAALVSIAAELEQKEKAFRDLDARLMRNEKYRTLRKPHIATLAEARNACGKDTAILEYVIWEEKDRDSDAFTHRQSYCLVITGSDQTLVALDRSFDYSGAVMKFRDAIIGHKSAAERDAAGALLYEKLITPAAQAIAGARNLIIVPDGSLAFLPFDALRESGDSPYLCESRSVTMSPSVSVMLMVKKRRFSADRRQFLAFGGAAYAPGGGAQRGAGRSAQKQRATAQSKEYYAGEGDRGRARYYRNLGMEWDNIPGTLDEVTEIDRAVYRREGTRVITGAAVSESKIKELSRKNELARYRSVHFACHGYYDADMPSYSAVVLSEVSGSLKSSDDGYLSVPEVALMKLQADIVNLSACETGLGAVVQGDGVVGLARAFQEAGANRVGVTLWEVADEPTKEFMVGVYRKAIRGKAGFSDAVTATKKEFIRSREYGDPYFWSGYVLYGR